MLLMEDTSRSKRRISTANMVPAMGAWKVAAMPPAAPHATASRRLSAPREKSWDMEEPMEAPIWTTGPSLPTEAPADISVEVTRVFKTVTLCLIRPPSRARAFITCGTPGPRISGAHLATTTPEKSPAPAGISSLSQTGTSASSSGVVHKMRLPQPRRK